MNSKHLAIISCVFATLCLFLSLYFIIIYKPDNKAAEQLNRFKGLEEALSIERLSLPRLETINNPEFQDMFYRTEKFIKNQFEELLNNAQNKDEQKKIEQLHSVQLEAQTAARSLRRLVNTAKVEQPVVIFDIDNKKTKQYIDFLEKEFTSSPSIQIQEKLILLKNMLQQQNAMQRDLTAAMATGDSIYLVQVEQESTNAAERLDRFIKDGQNIDKQEIDSLQEALKIYQSLARSATTTNERLSEIIDVKNQYLALNSQISSDTGQIITLSSNYIQEQGRTGDQIASLILIMVAIPTYILSIILVWRFCLGQNKSGLPGLSSDKEKKEKTNIDEYAGYS